jgi:hypothetical protein
MNSLQNMTLSENLLFGSIPSQFGLLNKLVDLRISRAGMGGLLPSEMGVMTGLAVLELTQSNFRGIIPTELGKLSLLSKLISSIILPKGFSVAHMKFFDVSFFVKR